MEHQEHQPDQPFQIEDLRVFDNATLQRLVATGGFGLTIERLAWSLHALSTPLTLRLLEVMSPAQRSSFLEELHRPLSEEQVLTARRQLLDDLFWELTYWKTPEMYEELTEGEVIHPAIFQALEPDLRNKIVLDAGAGSGRASFECLRHGAALVYAVEPAPGLVHILERKRRACGAEDRLIIYRGCFEALPLADRAVDLALSCAAFSAAQEQGGEAGLAELQRVTRPGGKIVLIWARQADRDWLTEHGFCCLVLPSSPPMEVRFRSLESALRCARRFYHNDPALLAYLHKERRPEVPFSLLGRDSSCHLCWLQV
jgi:ubiquinone/menaquinone biosynthesis C-methylase UbiE